ncbi:MAG: succinate dehydrogenase, partial [Heliobacteriaceae bacterium]|nr:succinate dehydrogenase [Heliobacteriaceae bacterium]
MTDQNHFLIRKLHSLLGLFPVGAFFFEHTLTNSFTLIGPDLLEKWCWCLHNLPFKVPIEILFIFIPLAFHALYGLWIVYVAKN